MARTTVVFSAEQAAAALWTYGEDDLAERALALTDGQMPTLWSIAGSHWTRDHGLPVSSKLVLDKVTAFVAIEFIEGRVRPLAQERRRPRAKMPERLRNARPVAPGTAI